MKILNIIGIAAFLLWSSAAFLQAGTPDNGTPGNGAPDNGSPSNGVPDNGQDQPVTQKKSESGHSSNPASQGSSGFSSPVKSQFNAGASPNGNNLPKEQINMSYDQLKVQYQSQTAGGSAAANGSALTGKSALSNTAVQQGVTQGSVINSTIGSATGGAGGGKAKFNEFNIKKNMGQASPSSKSALGLSATGGTHFKKAQIVVRKAGGNGLPPKAPNNQNINALQNLKPASGSAAVTVPGLALPRTGSAGAGTGNAPPPH